MPWVDPDTNDTVPQSDVDAQFKSYSVTPPSSVVESVVRGAGKVLPRVGTMTVGGEAGAAIGGVIGGPPGAAVGGVVGSGLGNVAGKYLPEAIGGTPQESVLSAFGYGAVPEAAGRGVGSYLESRALKGGAQDAYEHLVKQLEDVPTGGEDLQSLSRVMGPRVLRPHQPLTGESLTDATHELRRSVLSQLDTKRKALGEPIGEAYRNLKTKGRLSEADATDLADAAKDIRDGLISPTSSANPIFQRIKKYHPPEQSKLGGFMEQDLAEHMADLEQTPTGDYIKKGEQNREALGLQNYTPEQIDKIVQQRYKPPTYDELRDLRQTVNQRLRIAGGGDAHALLNLQQAIDEKLMPLLPDTLGRDRQLYAGFITRFPWKDVRRLNAMGTPREISQYVFGGGPERALELLHNAPANTQGIMREALTDHIMSGVDPNLPAEDQVKQIRRSLGSFVSNGVADKVWGRDAAVEMRDILYSPLHRQRLAKMLSKDEQQQQFAQTWISTARLAPKKQTEAAERGFEALMNTLPAADRQAILSAATPSIPTPVMPETESSLARAMQPADKNTMVTMGRRRLAFAGPYSVARIAMGSPAGAAYGAATAAAFGTWAATSAGYRALMDRGGASMMAKVYASPTSRVYAKQLIKFMAKLGSSGIEQVSHSEDEPVEMSQ